MGKASEATPCSRAHLILLAHDSASRFSGMGKLLPGQGTVCCATLGDAQPAHDCCW